MNKQKIEAKALELAELYGFANLTKAQLCEALDIPDGSFHHFYGCTFLDFCESMRKKYPATTPDEITRGRVNPDDRRAFIVAKALQLAKPYGFDRITRLQVAKFAGISPSLVSRHFSMVQLRSEVLKLAVETENLEVIAQGWVKHHVITQGLPADLVGQVCDYLALEHGL